ncbi:unannotated protein [freshwater metagenome]|uniref:Unannotated protein n=1 Tax=freshwater metagenome TaxID=449393 RepID=A0A6J7VGF2_9ZZZZ
MIEFVDAVGEFGGDRGFGLCATEDEDAVKCAKCTFALISTGSAGGRKLRNELRPRSDEAGIGEIENRPKIAQSVFNRSAGERESR